MLRADGMDRNYRSRTSWAVVQVAAKAPVAVAKEVSVQIQLDQALELLAVVVKQVVFQLHL